MTDEEKVLSTTESLCPECLRKVSAENVSREYDVYLRKTCPEHGDFETVIWRGMPDYVTWDKSKIPAYPDNPFTPLKQGCPYDCGLCPEHRQQPCCVLLEVTQRCDLKCPLCFASAGTVDSGDPGLSTIAGWYQKLKAAGGPFNIQLSGGEPCLRDDLPEIIALGKSMGFEFFQVNTNGLRLSQDFEYFNRLKDAGLSTVYLQFDGTDDVIYEKIRGCRLLSKKMAVIEQCKELKIGVVLVPTIVPGINSDDIGNLLLLAVQYSPTVRGLHFQPISYFGRYPHLPLDKTRITLPEIIALLEEQSNGLVKTENFKPSNGENAHCSFHGNFVVMQNGTLKPITQHNPKSCCSTPVKAQDGRNKAQAFVAKNWSAPTAMEETSAKATEFSLGEWDDFIIRARTHVLSISGMAFQDAWTIDLNRLRDCYILTIAPDGSLIPFCAYNLTSRNGKALYRGNYH